ncbi:ATP-grasp domain-containing protein [Nesterenkonia lutea]|uniref:ATP-grasp superfamily ATP-dependent carboligase n=1 Tax=Nesterenkonia lutea TaxID=272919 RepID=A0ABR9JCP0_9MICC|nr:ATP-grasp domain-containing protein [Nesterenkonia lutea]MBE1523699.1 putative ATP-grasp superfamily ATP-dependent carboligase [Nesterenkonia lutea]
MEDRRALIVSTARDRGALAAVRALNSAGWTVGVGTPDGAGMVTASNACAHRHVVARPRGDGSAFVSGVQEAVRSGRYDIVFGAGDDWMAALAEFRDQIPAPVAHPRASAVRTALDKLELAEAAARAGLAAPRTVAGTPEALRFWIGPVVVKCREHWSPGQTRPHRIEAQRFDRPQEALGQLDRITASGARAVLQKPIDGSLSALVGLFHRGRLDGRVQQVSSRVYPTPNGVSTRAHTVPVDSALASRAEALLSDIGWEGLVELQFLLDEHGTPHLIDLNGRFYGSMALADAARPGLAHTWALRTLGEPAARLEDAPEGHRYVWGAGDVRRALVERRENLSQDLRETVLWGRGARHSVWDPRDMGPTRQLVLDRLGLPGRSPRT